MAQQDLVPDTNPPVRSIALSISVLSVLGVVGVLAFLVFWPSEISPWLQYQTPGLTPLGAVATGAAALIGAFGLGVAGIAAVAALRQVRLQGDMAKAALEQVRLQRAATEKASEIAAKQSSRECLWRLSDRWRLEIVSPREEKGSYWTRAHKALQFEVWKHDRDADGFVGKANQDVLDVLNFFESVGHMCRRGDMDESLAYNTFSGNALYYWDQVKDFVEAYRSGTIRRTDDWRERPNESDPTFYEDYEWFAGRLVEITAEDKEKAQKEALTST